MIIEHQLEISSDATVVWDVISDFRSYPEWNPFVVSCTSNLVVGSDILMRVRVLPFWAQPQREQILRHEPGRVLCYGLQDMPFGSLTSTRCHEVTPLGSRSTLYESRFKLDGWISPLVGALLGRRLTKGFNAMSEAIRVRAQALQAG